MTQKIDHPYVDAPPPPWWLRRIKFLRLLWFNPLFQRNYRKSRLKPLLPPRAAFWIGILYGVILLSVLDTGPIVLVYIGRAATIPLSIYIMIEIARCFIECLVNTPQTIKADLDSDHLSPILATPMSDRDIYNSMIFPNFVRSMEVIQSQVIFVVWIILPSLIFGISMSFLGPYYSLGPPVIFITLYILSLVIYIVAILLLISYAAGFYSTANQVFGAIASALFFTFGFTLLPIFGWWGFCWMMIGNQSGNGCGTAMMMYILPFYVPGLNLLGLVFIFAGAGLARMLGVRAFSQLRRSGIYSSEGLTASGLEIENP
jgi:hypothetical protein